jgi:hypothetical protein
VQREIAAAPLAAGRERQRTLRCSLDGAAYTPCQHYDGLAEGPHTLHMKAVASGFDDPSPAVSFR